MHLRGVILDVDGTLVDSNDAHAHAWVAAFARGGYRIPFEAVRPLIGMGSDHILAKLPGVDKDRPEGRKLRRWRQEIFMSRYIPRLRAFPYVRPLLQSMKDDGFTLVVASSAEPEELRQLLRIADVADLIDHITSSGDVPRSKPAPDIVAAALNDLDYSANEVVMLGDTPYDIAAARQAGVATVALRCGGWNDRQLAGAIAVYNDPDDLLTHYDTSPLGRHDVYWPTLASRLSGDTSFPAAVRALSAGFAGAVTVTLLNETGRRLLSDAPRLDELGMRALARAQEALGQQPPTADRLRRIALYADLLTNSAYYSLVGVRNGKGAWRRGALLGLAAGIGAVILPPVLGLGRDSSARTPATAAMTVGWYLAGGLAAAAAWRRAA